MAFDRALALDPDDTVALSGKGSLLHKRGRNRQQTALMGERAVTPAMWARHIVRNVNTTVLNLVLIALLVGILGIPVYIGLQRVGQLIRIP